MGFGLVDDTEEMEKEWEEQRQINNMRQAMSDANLSFERGINRRLTSIENRLNLIFEKLKEKENAV